jgi:hypothetical protein
VPSEVALGDGTSLPPGFPIRKSRDPSSLAAPPSVSPLAASFIGIWPQGIHPAPYSLVSRSSAFVYRPLLLGRCSFGARVASCSFNSRFATRVAPPIAPQGRPGAPALARSRPVSSFGRVGGSFPTLQLSRSRWRPSPKRRLDPLVKRRLPLLAEKASIESPPHRGFRLDGGGDPHNRRERSAAASRLLRSKGDSV